MLKKSSIPWTIKQLYSMNEKGRFNFDIAIQRKGDIWDIHRKSLLINSLLEGYPIPALFAKYEGEIYYFIDGKQRLTTIFSYLNDDFGLSDRTPDVDGIEIRGLRYSELPEDFQQIIKQTTLTVTRFENISDVEIEELFFRLNNGVSLRSIESIRVLLGTRNLQTILKITKHPFFMEKVSISKKRYTDQEVILQLMMLTKSQDTGLSSNELRLFVENYRRQPFEDALLDELLVRLDYLNQAFPKKQSFLKKIHIPMLYYVVDIANKNDVPPQHFQLWATDFYKNLSKDSPYYLASQSGSAKKENVQIRLSEIQKSFENSIKNYEKSVVSIG